MPHEDKSDLGRLAEHWDTEQSDRSTRGARALWRIVAIAVPGVLFGLAMGAAIQSLWLN